MRLSDFNLGTRKNVTLKKNPDEEKLSRFYVCHIFGCFNPIQYNNLV